MSFVILFSAQCKQSLVLSFSSISDHLSAEMESIQHWLPYHSENLMLFLVHLDIQGPEHAERQVQTDMHQFFNYLDAFDEFHIRVYYNTYQLPCDIGNSSTYHVNNVVIDYQW